MSLFWRSFAELWQLAWPLALVQLNNNLTGAVDTALAGRLDAATLAATGVGASLYTVFAVLAMCAGLGLDPYISQALGRGEQKAASAMLWQGVWLAAMLSVPLLGLYMLCMGNLAEMGLGAGLTYGVQQYLLGRGIGVPAACLVGVLRSFLQAKRLARPILISALAMNVFNVVADWLLLFGDDGLAVFGLPGLGLPSFGVFGLGLASGLASWLQLGVLLLTMRHVGGPAASVRRPSLAWARRLCAMGLPASAQMLVEVGIFSLVAIMMGGMGEHAAAAHQAALMLASLSFSLCVGLAAATAVHVGRAVGQGSVTGVRTAGVAGLVLVTVTMTISSLLMWLMPRQLIGLMTDDAEVFVAAEALLCIAGAFQIVDGVQAVAAGALRGAGSARFSFWANLAAHWGTGMPLGYYLAYRAGWGPTGLWWGLTFGLALVAVALCWQFWRVSARRVSALYSDA